VRVDSKRTAEAGRSCRPAGNSLLAPLDLMQLVH